MTAPDQPRVPELDGLRGIAILMVVVLHFTFLETHDHPTFVPIYAARLGFIGVDLFFVLSGFLITGILLDSKGEPGYYRNFYARRFLRIFPLWYLFLVFVFFVAPRIAFPMTEAPFGRWWYFTYLTNFALVRYGESNAIPDIGWSLAIEEQFYLVWPAIVALLPPRALRRLCIAIVAAAIALRGILGPGRFEAAYFLAPARMDPLAIGALAALMVREGAVPSRRLLARLAVLLGFLIVVLRIAEPALRSGLMFTTAGYTIVALFFACALLLAISGDGRNIYRRLMRSRMLRSFGKYSYAIYLWHLVVKEAMLRVEPVARRLVAFPRNPIAAQAALYAAGISLSWIAGWLSWQLFERHWLRLKRFFPSRSPLARESAKSRSFSPAPQGRRWPKAG